jgi:hypothetical protein
MALSAGTRLGPSEIVASVDVVQNWTVLLRRAK